MTSPHSKLGLSQLSTSYKYTLLHSVAYQLRTFEAIAAVVMSGLSRSTSFVDWVPAILRTDWTEVFDSVFPVIVIVAMPTPLIVK